MENLNYFDVSLFIFVLFTSGILYLPINRWQHKIAKRQEYYFQLRLKRKRAKVRAFKNLKATSNKLSHALQS